MKKSNKLSVSYIMCSVILLGVLLFGGIYGVYVSVGLSFVRSSVLNVADGMQANGVSNVSYGGAVNFSPSMVGVIILSIALIVLAIFDIVALIKQIVFFKQFKAVRDSGIEQAVEKKVKSKGAVVFFACVVDILSIVTGVAGIFVNARSFSGNNVSWVLYVIDALVAIFALVSLILLIIKLKSVKNLNKNKQKENKSGNMGSKTEYKTISEYNAVLDNKVKNESEIFDANKIDKLEYVLLKLKYLKSSKLISMEEYEYFRKMAINKPEHIKRCEIEMVQENNDLQNKN